MITSFRAAELCAALYGRVTDNPVKFSQIDYGDDDGVCWAVAREGLDDVVVLRGSVTPEDWIADVMAVPYVSRRLGPVHHGFYLGLDNVWEDLQIVLRKGSPTILVGHSLGAARAALLAGFMVTDNRIPTARIVFGEPKPAFQQLADLTKDVPTQSFRCGDGINHDVVTSLPFNIPRLGLLYVHQTTLIDVVTQADPNDQSGMFTFHHIELYMKATKGV